MFFCTNDISYIYIVENKSRFFYSINILETQTTKRVRSLFEKKKNNKKKNNKKKIIKKKKFFTIPNTLQNKNKILNLIIKKKLPSPFSLFFIFFFFKNI